MATNNNSLSIRNTVHATHNSILYLILVFMQSVPFHSVLFRSLVRWADRRIHAASQPASIHSLKAFYLHFAYAIKATKTLFIRFDGSFKSIHIDE